MKFRGKAYQIQLVLSAFILVYGKDAKMIDVMRTVNRCK